MKQSIPFAVAAVVLCVTGAGIAGYLTERWGTRKSERLDNFTARIAKIPTVIGDWEGTDTEVDQKQIDASHCTAYVSRVYENQMTGKHVTVFAVSGTGRHCTIHTPRACYPAAGFVQQGGSSAFTVPNESGGPEDYEFETASFLRKTATEYQHQRVFWTFSDDGIWLGPAAAKAAFGMKPAMYKVYLINPADDSTSPEEDISVEFAREFMPVLDAVLFPAAASAEEEPEPAESEQG